MIKAKVEEDASRHQTGYLTIDTVVGSGEAAMRMPRAKRTVLRRGDSCMPYALSGTKYGIQSETPRCATPRCF